MTGAEGEGHLLVFEIAGSGYALPIAEVLEVTELGPLAGVPMLPRELAAVMNHHGEALPIVAREALLEGAEPLRSEAAQVIVIGRPGHEAGRLGLPVDRVLGLVEGAPGSAGPQGLVVDRRAVDGRVVAVLDGQRLCERARGLVEKAAGRGTSPLGREA